MFHGTLTLITPLRPEAVEDARSVLKELSRAIQAREPQPFRQIEEIYFAHWGIGGDESQSLADPEPSRERCLIFGADVRLTKSLRGQAQMRAAVKLLVERLAAQPPESTRSFDALYRHCEGYPARGLRAPAEVERYLLAHAVPYNMRHVDFAYRVSTVADIRTLISLRQKAEAFLNEEHRSAWVRRVGVSAVHGALREQFAPSLSGATLLTWQRSLRLALRTAALATLAFVPIDGFLGVLLGIRSRLKRPRRTTEYATVPDSVREQIELRQGPVQNSMILISSVPETLLGRLQQRFFMTLISWRLLRNVVGLSDMRNIHIARWALFRRGSRRHLLFMVTYDESWESYIDTFVDHADMATFLKLIWSDTKGFPPGQPFMEPFKRWIRSVQCPLQVHYSAFLHGGARPQPFALTDLYEFSELRRVLAEEGALEPREAAGSRALGHFLQHGCFPYQDKGMSPWHSLRLLFKQLLSSLRPPLVAPSPTRLSRARPAPERPALTPPSLPLSRSVTHVSKT